MKQTLLKSLLLLLSITIAVPQSIQAQVEINETNFPDENFRAYIQSWSYAKDGVLTDEELNKITSLDLSARRIKSLKGIEYFTSLTTLILVENRLTSLDVSKNTALKRLECFDCQITELDVSHNTALEILKCGGQQVTGSYGILVSLNVSNNPSLKTLDCSNNSITSLDISNCSSLTDLKCYKNQLSSLDVSNNTALISLDCHWNQLSSLDVSNNTALTSLDCQYNSLSSLDVSKCVNLEFLNCASNQIRDVNMDALINGLPRNTTSKEFKFYVIQCESILDNSFTATQVAAVNDRGWTPYYKVWDWDVSNRVWKVHTGVIMPEGIYIIPNSITIKVGDVYTLEYILDPKVAETTVTWYSDDSSIASVDASGNIIGVKEGTTYIYITTENGKTGRCQVTVEANNPTGITVSPATKTIKENEAFTLTYTLEPSDAEATVTWSSDDESIATVNADGTVTGVKAGTTKIHAKTSNDLDAYCEVTVEEIVAEGIKIDATNFPDDNFRAYLFEQDYGQDGVITEEEISEVTEIDNSIRDIRNLKGIEYFTELQYLECSGNSLATLDLSKNAALKELYCVQAGVETLDVSNNKALEILNCANNKLYSLDFSNNPALRVVNCAYNKIKDSMMDELAKSLPLNTTGNVHPIYVLADSDDEGNVCTTLHVAEIRERGWTPIYYDVYGRLIEYAGSAVIVDPTDITVYPFEKTIKVGDTFTLTYELTPADAQTTVTWKSGDESIAVVDANGQVVGMHRGTTLILATTSNGITDFCEVTVEDRDDPDATGIAIDETNFPDKNFRDYLLSQYYGKDGILTEKEISEIDRIDNLWGSEIRNLKGIEFFTALTHLDCSGNDLTSLDVSKNTVLTDLDCSMNNLASLDLSKNTALEGLDCFGNNLTSLDLSKNTALENLDCSSNLLTNLDLTQNTSLNSLWCSFNELSSLDVSKNVALEFVACSDNQIKGTMMDELIKSLPLNTTGEEHQIVVFNSTTKDGNVCTTTQVADIKARGWTPCYYYDENEWAEYAGSEPSGINGILMDVDKNAPIYNLNGQRVSMPRKGINIIGGKKVVVK